MNLKNKIRLAILVFILIGYAFVIPLNINNAAMKETLKCVYGSPLKIIFNLFTTILMLSWIYLGLMLQLETYQRNGAKSDSLIDFFVSRAGFKDIKELFSPSYKKDPKYMRMIIMVRWLSVLAITTVLIGGFLILPKCPFVGS